MRRSIERTIGQGLVGGGGGGMWLDTEIYKVAWAGIN
jgi:hypothetical protein